MYTAVEVLGWWTFALAAIATGCATGAPHDTLPHRYRCEGTMVTRTDDALLIDGTKASLLGRDKEGDRFALSSAGDAGEYSEYVMPHDSLLDATVSEYRVTDSPDPASWPLRDRGVCVAEGGYTDVLRRYMIGASIGDVAKQLALDEGEARKRIGTALARLRCRYLGGC